MFPDKVIFIGFLMVIIGIIIAVIAIAEQNKELFFESAMVIILCGILVIVLPWYIILTLVLVGGFILSQEEN